MILFPALQLKRKERYFKGFKNYFKPKQFAVKGTSGLTDKKLLSPNGEEQGVEAVN